MIGSFHIGLAEVRTEEGKLYLCVAIDRTSKFAYAELHASMPKALAADVLRHVLASAPYKIHSVLTDNSIQLTDQARHRYAFQPIFARVCDAHGSDHELTKPNHWANGHS
jgi:Integrase core domain